MWPWEHLAAGYLCYSLLVHLLARRAPRAWPVVALAFGTQVPDLVDKPLAWTLGILPSGHSLAHSLFVALPVSALVVTVAWGLGRRQVGAAFAFGYLSHLPGDVLYPVLVGGEPNFGFLFWPLVPAAEPETSVGLLATVRTLLDQYVTELASSTFTPYLALELGLLLSVFLLWLYDGMPPLRSLWSRYGVGPNAEETP